MAVVLQTFQLSVTLRKLVQRKDSQAGAAAAGADEIDLTPLLADTDSVRTVKSLSQPGGGFTISIADQNQLDLNDTVYALIEPMDLVEIRASRAPQSYVDQKLPLIMRGFVSSVQRAESISDDGTPSRQVVVHGIDFGKLWQINQVLFQYLHASGAAFLDPFLLQAHLGIDGAPLEADVYMGKLVDFVNTKVKGLAAYSGKAIPAFTTRMVRPGGRAFVQAVSSKEGSIWGYVEAFCDRPWNEAFVIDEEAGPVFVFRPVPYKELSTGKVFIPGAVDPGFVAIAAVDLLAIDVSRSDARVANFFWVPPTSGTLESGNALTAASLANATPLDLTYPNNVPTLYGERMMSNPTQLMPSETPLPPAMTPIEKRQAAVQSLGEWYALKAAQLRTMNRDNAILEEGSASVNGNETLKIGLYARITRGSIVSEAYINHVSHVISPYHAWVTSLGLERGDGFYKRDKDAAGFPFFAEGRDGPYTPKPKA
jgi:hypothetical protein